VERVRQEFTSLQTQELSDILRSRVWEISRHDERSFACEKLLVSIGFQFSESSTVRSNHSNIFVTPKQFGKHIVRMKEHVVIPMLVNPCSEDIFDAGEINDHSQIVQSLNRLDRHLSSVPVPVEMLALPAMIQNPMPRIPLQSSRAGDKSGHTKLLEGKESRRESVA
jgi:hypothetical protein